MKTPVFVGFVAVIAVGLLAAIWFGSRSSRATVDKNDPNRPIAKLEQTSTDLGIMTVRDKRSSEFTVANEGKSDLILSRFATSCDCIYASIIRPDGSESKTFTMHADNSWEEIIKPGQSVKLKATYEPAIMPVSGKVERIVSFGTNDPNLPKAEIKVTATVQ